MTLAEYVDEFIDHASAATQREVLELEYRLCQARLEPQCGTCIYIASRETCCGKDRRPFETRPCEAFDEDPGVEVERDIMAAALEALNTLDRH